MSRLPTKGIDYTSKDYESFRNDMIKQLGIKMPEYTDIRQSDAGIVLLELLAQGLDVLSFYQDALANEAYLSTAEQRSTVLKWCQMLNYFPKTSTPAEFLQVFVLSSPQDTNTTIPAGTKVKTVGTASEPSVYFETVSDLVIPKKKLGDEKDLEGNYLYSVKVVQGISVSEELLGTSSGAANQSFTLNYSPVILDSIEVYINEGVGFERWSRVNNFVDSTPTSKHYTVRVTDMDEAVITFGDGVFGKIPHPYENGIFCDYRVGGGTQGNVGANRIILLDSNIAVIDRTFNPHTALVEGQEKESLEEIKVNAPVSNKTRWGALTEEDFAEVVKMNFNEVDKAVSYTTGEVMTDINIYVLLKGDAELTEDFRKKALDLFDENKGGRKIIGSETISVLPAIKTPVDINATLAIQPRYDFDTVKKGVEDFIKDYFAVGNYDFNTELSLSKLSADVQNPENAIDGIRFFKITSPAEDIMTPGKGAIYTLGTLTISEGGV